MKILIHEINKCVNAFISVANSENDGLHLRYFALCFAYANNITEEDFADLCIEEFNSRLKNIPVTYEKVISSLKDEGYRMSLVCGSFAEYTHLEKPSVIVKTHGNFNDTVNVFIKLGKYSIEDITFLNKLGV